MRNDKGQFVKGFGFWTGKKRPGFKTSTAFKKGQIAWNKGKKIKTNNALEVYFQNNENRPRGEKHYNWKGGVTVLRKQIQDTYLYKKWRKSIFERDNYTCMECGATRVYLHADHIKAYSQIIKENKISTVEQAKECLELWDLLNGRTLCVPCHRDTDTYGVKSTSVL